MGQEHAQRTLEEELEATLRSLGQDPGGGIEGAGQGAQAEDLTQRCLRAGEFGAGFGAQPLAGGVGGTTSPPGPDWRALAKNLANKADVVLVDLYDAGDAEEAETGQERPDIAALQAAVDDCRRATGEGGDEKDSDDEDPGETDD